jgi:phage terminase large subunit-like protein
MRISYQRMTAPMSELMRLVKAGELIHGGHPVARYCIDSLEVRHHRDDPDLLRPVKPERKASAKRIDGAVSLILAIAAQQVGDAEDQYAQPSAMFV